MRAAALRRLSHQGGAFGSEHPLCSGLFSPAVAPQLCLPSVSNQMQQQRGLQLLNLFSREGRDKRRERLREDLQRGYFDDFKELKDTGGKLWRAPDRLIPADAAKPFPHAQVFRSDGTKSGFPPPPEVAPQVSLVCIGFKEGSEEMLASWSDPFVRRFHACSCTTLVELSVVESKVMALWPFRSLIMRAPQRAARTSADSPTAAAVASSTDASSVQDREASTTAAASSGSAPAQAAPGDGRSGSSECGSSSSSGGSSTTPAAGGAKGGSNVDPGSGNGGSGSGGSGMQSEYLFFFRDAYDLCKALGMTNRLVGYVFLLDRQGKVRFRGCGVATAAEQQALTAAAEQLLDAG